MVPEIKISTLELAQSGDLGKDSFMWVGQKLIGVGERQKEV
jgi:hypothetical protein